MREGGGMEGPELITVIHTTVFLFQLVVGVQAFVNVVVFCCLMSHKCSVS